MRCQGGDSTHPPKQLIDDAPERIERWSSHRTYLLIYHEFTVGEMEVNIPCMEHLVFMTYIGYIGITKLTLHWKREIWSCMEGMAKVGSFLAVNCKQSHLDWFRDHDGWNCAVIMFSDQNSGLLVVIPIKKTPPIISAPWGFDDPPRRNRCLSMPFNLELYTLDLILWTNRMCRRILVLIDLNPRVFHQSEVNPGCNCGIHHQSVNLFH